jgi:hypothetical protein
MFVKKCALRKRHDYEGGKPFHSILASLAAALRSKLESTVIKRSFFAGGFDEDLVVTPNSSYRFYLFA